MILPVALIVLATPQPPLTEKRQAHAMVRVVLPYRATFATWNPNVVSNQREVLRREADGSLVLIRLTEFE